MSMTMLTLSDWKLQTHKFHSKVCWGNAWQKVGVPVSFVVPIVGCLATASQRFFWCPSTLLSTYWHMHFELKSSWCEKTGNVEIQTFLEGRRPEKLIGHNQRQRSLQLHLFTVLVCGMPTTRTPTYNRQNEQNQKSFQPRCHLATVAHARRIYPSKLQSS